MRVEQNISAPLKSYFILDFERAFWGVLEIYSARIPLHAGWFMLRDIYKSLCLRKCPLNDLKTATLSTCNACDVCEGKLTKVRPTTFAARATSNVT